MLLDVMTNHTHLFSDTETSFLGCLFYFLPIPSYDQEILMTKYMF
jgi:hypothetical protein